MKTNQIFIFGSIIVLAASQSLDSLPECGKTCVNNMFAKARELGCADGDTACLCKNINFAYGIRDCSSALCGALAAAPVITYGSNYCNSVGSGNGTDVSGGNGSLPLSPPAIPGPAPTNSAPASATNSPDGNRTPISTAPLVSTITTGNEPITTTLGFSTVYSSNEGTKPTDSSSTATTSSTSDSSQSSSQTEGESSTSAGSGARQTACAGLAAAAGLAAMLL